MNMERRRRLRQRRRLAVVAPTAAGALPSRAAAALTLALAAASPGTAAAAEDTRVEPMWLEPVSPRAAAPTGSHEVPALLHLPPGWTAGDAAALVVNDGLGAEDGRRLVAALIGEGAAVLEVDVRTARVFPRDVAAPPASPTPRELLPGLFGALVGLRRDVGAGLVVALGHGDGGQAALLAAKDDTAAPLLGADGPRFAAAAALGPGRPAFAAGPAPSAEEGWPTRAPLLCAALAEAAASKRAEAERDCMAALAPSAADPPAMAALADGRRRGR